MLIHHFLASLVEIHELRWERGGTEEDTESVCSLATCTVVNLRRDAQKRNRDSLRGKIIGECEEHRNGMKGN